MPVPACALLPSPLAVRVPLPDDPLLTLFHSRAVVVRRGPF